MKMNKGFISVGLIIVIIAILGIAGGATYAVKHKQNAQVKTTVDQNADNAALNSNANATVSGTIQMSAGSVNVSGQAGDHVNAVVGNGTKESTVTTNTQDSRFNTYTSYKLGISLDYPKVFTYNGKQISYSIKEEGNTLTLLLNGLTNWDGYLVSSKWDRHIEVFEKKSTETFEHAITERFIADTPKAIYCRVRAVVPPGSDSAPKYKAYQIEYTGPIAADETGAAASQSCSPYPQYPCVQFLTDEKTGKYFMPTGFCTQDMNVVSTKELGWGWWVNGVQIIE